MNKLLLPFVLFLSVIPQLQNDNRDKNMRYTQIAQQFARKHHIKGPVVAIDTISTPFANQKFAYYSMLVDVNYATVLKSKVYHTDNKDSCYAYINRSASHLNNAIVMLGNYLSLPRNQFESQHCNKINNTSRLAVKVGDQWLYFDPESKYIEHTSDSIGIYDKRIRNGLEEIQKMFDEIQEDIKYVDDK